MLWTAVWRGDSMFWEEYVSFDLMFVSFIHGPLDIMAWMLTSMEHIQNTVGQPPLWHIVREFTLNKVSAVFTRFVVRCRTKFDRCCTGVIFTSWSDIKMCLLAWLDRNWQSEVRDRLKSARKSAKRTFQIFVNSFVILKKLTLKTNLFSYDPLPDAFIF